MGTFKITRKQEGITVNVYRDLKLDIAISYLIELRSLKIHEGLLIRCEDRTSLVVIDKIEMTYMKDRVFYEITIPHDLASLTLLLEYLAAWEDVALMGVEVKGDKYEARLASSVGHLKRLVSFISENS